MLHNQNSFKQIATRMELQENDFMKNKINFFG